MTPQLRFPEFTDEWQVKKLGDILSVGSGRDYKHLKIGNIPVYGTGGLMTHVNEYLYDGKSVAIGRKGTIDQPQFLKGKFWTVDTLFYTYDYKNSVPEFIFLLFQNINWKKWNEASGVPSLSSSTIKSIKVNIPSKPEQEKIAYFLTAVDERIAVGEKKLELLETYKSGVMQKIFSQQVRFKDENGSSYPDWEQKKLGEILKEVNEKTEKSNKFETLSSTTKGLFSQKDYFSKNIASDDNTGYKVLRINQIVLSPQNLWMGNINFNDKFEAGIVSPSYKIFETVRAVSGYLRHILKTRRMLYEYTQASEQGASIVRRNLDISSFMAISVTIPTVQEQQKIATFLTTLDEKITAEKSKLTAARQFKKALLQRMFV